MTQKANRRQGRPIRRIPKGRRMDVRREEFNRLIDLLNERAEIFERILHNQKIQFQRIAEIQAELDLIKRVWAKQRPTT